MACRYAHDYAEDQRRLEQLERELKVFDEQQVPFFALAEDADFFLSWHRPSVLQAKRDEEERAENQRQMHHMEILARMETSSRLLQVSYVMSNDFFLLCNPTFAFFI